MDEDVLTFEFIKSIDFSSSENIIIYPHNVFYSFLTYAIKIIIFKFQLFS